MTCKYGYVWCYGWKKWEPGLPRPCQNCIEEVIKQRKEIYMVEYLFINPHSRYDNLDHGWQGSGWYFWDETLTYCYGPYESAIKAQDELYQHNKRLEEGTD